MSSDDSTPAGLPSGVLEALRPREALVRRRGRNPSKATLAFYRIGGRGVALKSFADHPLVLRATVGRWSIARETRAYLAAEGAVGLPEFFGRVGPYCLALEWLDAVPLAELEAATPAVFDELASIVSGLHQRGVALGDVHHGDVLLAADGSVHLVDLATAVLLGEHPGSFRRALFRRLCSLDRIAVARLRARFLGGDPEAATLAVGGSMAAWHRRGRWLKARWDRLRGKGRDARRRGVRDNRTEKKHE